MNDLIINIAGKSSPERAMLKVAEECTELTEVILKTYLKPDDKKPSIDKLVEEAGDVLFRLKVMAICYDIWDRIQEREYEKGLQVDEYLQKEKAIAAQKPEKAIKGDSKKVKGIYDQIKTVHPTAYWSATNNTDPITNETVTDEQIRPADSSIDYLQNAVNEYLHNGRVKNAEAEMPKKARENDSIGYAVYTSGVDSTADISNGRSQFVEGNTSNLSTTRPGTTEEVMIVNLDRFTSGTEVIINNYENKKYGITE